MDKLTRIALGLGRLIPDALTTSIALLVLVVAVALAMGNSLTATMDAYYRGLWLLLPFTMQMTLILVLSSTLGATQTFRRLVRAVSRVPRTTTQVLGLSILLSAALSYLYWGLGIALGPVIAIYFAREAEARGLKIDFPFLLAATGAGWSVWQFGLSSSAPLMMNTPGHFLESITGLMPLRTTIFAPASLVFVALFLIALLVAARVMLPRRPETISSFPDSLGLAEPLTPADPEPGLRHAENVESLSERIERHSVPTLVLCAMLAAWIGYHFGVKGAGLDLNSLNTILLFTCLLLHRNVRNFSKALQHSVVSAWPVVVLYHLYAGVAGLIQFTTVGENFAGFFATFSNRFTFPLLTATAAAVVSIFVPSSGGQWAIQGFITTQTAAAVGVTAQRGLLALSVGDHVGNLISPFWVVIAAGIARIDFRRFIGYNLAFAAIWFVLGVLVFTFLPA
ncbi:MAG TPA: TIGR00366 family protein [Gemmatimonadales bacterium]|nr:TIGR00366 family protein [Gemmatimonadales bacterium]